MDPEVQATIAAPLTWFRCGPRRGVHSVPVDDQFGRDSCGTGLLFAFSIQIGGSRRSIPNSIRRSFEPFCQRPREPV